MVGVVTVPRVLLPSEREWQHFDLFLLFCFVFGNRFCI